MRTLRRSRAAEAAPDRPSLREAATPWLFIAPSLILLLVVGLYPVIFTLVVSFKYWVMAMGPPAFNGGANYVTALTSSEFGSAVARTMILIGVTLPIELVLGMLI